MHVIHSMAELHSMSHVVFRLLLHSWSVLQAVIDALAPLKQAFQDSTKGNRRKNTK